MARRTRRSHVQVPLPIRVYVAVVLDLVQDPKCTGPLIERLREPDGRAVRLASGRLASSRRDGVLRASVEVDSVLQTAIAVLRELRHAVADIRTLGFFVGPRSVHPYAKQRLGPATVE